MKKFSPSSVYSCVLIALSFLLIYPNSVFAQVTPVSVSLTPAKATVTIGAHQQLTVTVKNTANTAVAWSVNGVAGGSAATGTISAAGLYTAPASVQSKTIATVTAVSQADPTKSASSVLTVNPVVVHVTPTGIVLAAGAQQQFAARVLNTPNTAVVWLVSGVVGGSAAKGTITAQGLYTAPASLAAAITPTIKAQSVADPTRSSSIKIAVNPSGAVGVTASPTTVSLIGGGKQQFTATVTNSANTAVTWQVNGIAGGSAATGTVSSTGLYTAPATVSSQSTVTVKVVSQADATKSASAQVTLTPGGISINPTAKSLAGGGTQQFTATVTNSSNNAVTWQVNGVAGGSASTGTISTAGLYGAPATIASQTTVTVTAVSQADPTKSASAQVTLNPVSVAVAPLTVSISAGVTQPFTATVLNASSTAVTWKVNGVAGGSATTGTISSAGLYTSPTSVSTAIIVSVSAVSVADATKSATAQVTVNPTSTTTGTAFYVATTGNDSNPGTLASPWKTISHAASSSAVLAGATVYVRGGTYSESVTIGMSGTATAGPVTFRSYPGEAAIIDGTGLTPPTDQNGLINIISRSYVTVSGFELRNYKTSKSSAVPAGIWVTGSGSNIKILNNKVHDITTSSESQGNAFGIAVYGSEAPASLDQVTIDGNEVYNLRTGGSESVNVDGNVTNFAITNNTVHDNDNIAIDAIGYEGVSSSAAYDIARNGVISDNIIYNISGKSNPGEGNDYDADGVYVDGGTQIIIERNLIHNVDIGIEVASEHKGKVASHVTVRNNVVYASNVVGISIGGYDSTVGGTDHCTIVNNTLYGNDTQNSGSGELQVQYYATNNIFKNNVVYATSQALFINNYTNSEANPVDVDYNLYYTSSGSADFLWNGSDHSSFSSYQSSTGKDPHSLFANPLFVNLNLSGINLDVLAGSPAVGKGTNLGAAVDGTLDFAGAARVQGANIDMGAFEQ